MPTYRAKLTIITGSAFDMFGHTPTVFGGVFWETAWKRPSPMKNPPHILQSIHRGRPAWIVDIPGSFTEKRRKKLFRSRSAADEFLRKSLANAIEVGHRAAFISSAREHKLLRLGRWLEANGIDPDAVPGILGKRSIPNESTATMDAAAEEFLAAKEARGCRERYLAKLRRTLRLFLLNRRELAVGEIGVKAVEEFLGRNGYRPATRKSYRSDLGAFFAWCVRRGYRADNPINSTEAPILDEKAPGILTADEARSLMESTQLHSPRLTPWVALVLFGGLRPDEARRIAWEDIRDGCVHVEGAKAKTRRRRLIPISTQLAAWLDAARAVEAPLPPIGWDRDWRRARVKAGLTDRYSHNALRHSFASYHFALHRRASETAAIMGHSEAMLFRHYRERVNPRDAEVFFGLLPDPDTLAAGMAEHRRPKHVPPHVIRRRKLEAEASLLGPAPTDSSPCNSCEPSLNLPEVSPTLPKT
jgi:integrase